MEDRGAEEPEQRIHGAIAGEAEATDLIACGAGIGQFAEWHRGIAEHADLGVGVAQVRDFYDLRETFEALLAIGAEEAVRRVDHMAAITREGRFADQLIES